MVIYRGEYFYGYARTVSVGVDAVGKGDDAEVAIWAAPCRCKIKKVSVIVNTAITGANTDYFTLGAKNKGAAGAGTSIIASKAFTLNVNAGQFDRTDLGACSNNLLNEGDTVTFYKTEAAGGMAMPALAVQIEYVRY